MNRLIVYCFILLIFSCEGPEGEAGPDGLSSLIRTSSEPAGNNCTYGGLAVQYGIDQNNNGLLEDDEVTYTEYVCSPASGSLISISSVSPGTDCINGGIRVNSGMDDNQNETLEEAEIDISHFICNGTDGSNGGSGISQEQIRLHFGERAVNNNTTSWMMADDESDYLIHFDKSNYPEADSISLGLLIMTTSSDGSVRCFAELYDVTNGQSVPNTEMETTQYSESNNLVYQFSGNILDDLPDGDVTLAVRVRSETQGTIVSASHPSYLLIYRNQ